MTPSPESYWIGNHYYTAEVIFLRIPKLSKIMMNRREVLSASSAWEEETTGGIVATHHNKKE